MSVGKKGAGKRINFGRGKVLDFCGLILNSVLFLRNFEFCNRAGSIAYNESGLREGGAFWVTRCKYNKVFYKDKT